MNNKMTLSEELIWRGFVNQTTIKDLTVLDNGEKITFYHGFDASAPSQTVGNLAAMMGDLVFLRHGHNAIVLAGGATSLIGDPGGKDKERPMQTIETINFNTERAKKQLEKIYQNHKFTMVNNIDWTKGVDVLEFLREVGKYFNVGEMIKKEYIVDRIGEGGNGISYTEFSYSLLQGFDFLHLYEKYNCTLQLGGSDQWSNCLAGVELIRKKLGKQADVLTLPLIINKATGVKFGKSEKGAVWLDPEKTSVNDFYQFWINTDDESVKEYLKIFTEISKYDYEILMKDFEADKSKRAAQKYLAYEVTRIVHGKDEAEKAKTTAEELFGGNKVNLDNLESFEVGSEFVVDGKINLVDFIVANGILKSKREVRDMLDGGGIYIDDEVVKESMIETDKKEFLLRIGKKKYYKVTT